MSETKPSIKPNNHKVHPCANERKIPLIKAIISKNEDKEIIITTSGDTTELKSEISAKNVRIFTDKELVKDENLSCEMLISYDLPKKAIIYMAKLSHTTSQALLILNKSEQNLLYSIETLLGRVIKQEIIEGYEEPKPEQADEKKPYIKKMTKDQIKEEAKKRYEDSTQEKPKKEYSDKPKDERWEKKKKEPNKFLGKDDNGKAIFSGKSGDRNHRYDGTPKERYGAPKKKGRTINIKALDKKAKSE